MTLTLTSTAFADGARIPEIYSCDGADISPPLGWSGAPAGTRSFALLCDDPDAPGGTWTHWAAFDIGADATGLRESYPKGACVDAVRQAITDFGRPGYGGPCPPRRHGVHHYHFRVLALDVAQLDLPADATFGDVAEAAEAHVLDRASLVGTYSRE
ncbi:MAG: YbhB/YbcL family Raf kinase inhibitor-like protein [Alphaproteobacteria bacterium]|nr:YbhB/YbcL family Raf kinase inhibitor-like protein [Alphaproteobacteria bacterium]